MNKVRRIAAIIGIILLLGMYVVAFVAGVGKWEHSHEVFMVALYMTIAVPVIIYIMQAFYKLGKKKNGESPEQSPGDRENGKDKE
ncbi:MAG: hypothetical protein IK071_08250 [Lachnospiraceae bacterium]|nr:hypothetical protein [Lachnospiraceae bacterium]